MQLNMTKLFIFRMDLDMETLPRSFSVLVTTVTVSDTN